MNMNKETLFRLLMLVVVLLLTIGLFLLANEVRELHNVIQRLNTTDAQILKLLP